MIGSGLKLKIAGLAQVAQNPMLAAVVLMCRYKFTFYDIPFAMLLF